MNFETLLNYFKETKELNMINHAYLFSNTKFEDIEELIIQICSLCFFKKSFMDFYSNPDLYIIEPEKNIIKKEKILELEENISKTSQINSSKLYIIKECDKLNSAAANCLLKTLEEPGENIYAFLITSNIENVMTTIKSRCQILNCEPILKKIDNIELIEKASKYIEFLEKEQTSSIAYHYVELYKNLEKQELKDIMSIILNFYRDCLNKKFNIKTKYFDESDEFLNKISNSRSEEEILSKIKILNDNIELLKYNLNGNLFIDKFLIEFGRV